MGKYVDMRRVHMKKCEVCQLLDSCPYCPTKSDNLVADDLSTNSSVGISVTVTIHS